MLIILPEVPSYILNKTGLVVFFSVAVPTLLSTQNGRISLRLRSQCHALLISSYLDLCLHPRRQFLYLLDKKDSMNVILLVTFVALSLLYGAPEKPNVLSPMYLS